MTVTAALGLDPGFGVLYVDTKARDSLACDLMEAIRPDVDAFLVDWITRDPLKRGTTQNNGAEFGTDYFTRSAVAKSNIFINRPNETKYFYHDLDSGGERLHGKSTYTVTFPKGKLPPVKGFWSLTLVQRVPFLPPKRA